ncbi:MAG: ABC transporter ATP-binding protein [Euzebyales bacterium]|nr:ABC transporter ATP-binding protein [Euzebyales bacterium]
MFSLAVAGAALYGLMTVASAVVLGEVTDRVVIPALEAGRLDRVALAVGCAAIVGVGMLKAVGIIVRRTAATYVQYKLEATFRERVTRRYQQLPLAWHQRRSTGELLSIANSDVETTWYPMAPLPFATGVVLMLVVTAVALLVTDGYLALIAFLVGPVMGYLNYRYNRRMEDPATRSQQLRAAVSARAHESFDGALVVKTLGRERAETDAFRGESERLRDELVDLGRIRALYDPVLEALPNIAVLAILLVGAARVAGGELSTGSLVTFAYLFTLLAFPVRLIGFVLSEFPRSVVGWDRIQAVLGADGDVDYGAAAGGADGPAAVDLVAVTFRYPLDSPGVSTHAGSRGLRDVTLEANPGRTIALVGPTGAGKSTIASLLVRLADPGEGAVRLDGHDLRTLRRGAVSQQAAIVFQHSFLFDDSVRENVTLGAAYTDAEVEQALRLAQASRFVAELPAGLDTVLGERGTSLSGGQRQRLALARALVRRPRLLILDDATSSVDTRIEAAILRGLQEAELPSTIVVVAYRGATIALADEIVFVQAGEIQARGSHDELLLAVPAYARLVHAYDDPAHDGSETDR